MENKQKPIVSYYKAGNPTLNYDWVSKLTDINIIQTKSLTNEFLKVCLDNKNKIFLHLVISGMGKSPFEPNIDSVKTTFVNLAKLINSGFPVKQVLVIVSPILSNDNGLKALELLLRVFTEFKILRLRNVRFSLLRYKGVDDSKKFGKKETIDNYSSYTTSSSSKPKYVVQNDNILKRPSTKTVMQYLFKSEAFYKDYYKLLKKYENIITIDKGEEALIGVKELMPFGFNNSWNKPDGTMDKIIHYENGNKYKPIVNIISNKFQVRCAKRCLLCELKQ